MPTLNLGRPEKPVCKPRSLAVKRHKLAENVQSENEFQNKKQKLNDNLTEMIFEIPENPSDNRTDLNSCDPEKSSKDLFNEIFSKERIKLPESWSQTNVSSCGEQGITFHDRVGIKSKSTNAHIHSVCVKDVTIDENVTLFIQINGKVFSHTDLSIKSAKMHSIHELELTIKAIHEIQVCHGSPDIEINEKNLKNLQSFTHSDSSNIVRHRSCLVILKKDEEKKHQCKCCKVVEQRLAMKILRKQHNKLSNYLKVNDLSPERKKKC